MIFDKCLKIVPLLVLSIAVTISANAQKTNFLSYYGADGFTIIHNNTEDSIAFEGKFYEQLPQNMVRVSFTIPPKQTDTLKIRYNFRQFTDLKYDKAQQPVRFYNGPGETINCYLEGGLDGFKIRFEGNLSMENYYHQHALEHSRKHDYQQESVPKNISGATNLDRYAALSDLALKRNLQFLDHQADLSPSFKEYERSRLLYANAADRLSTYLISAHTTSTEIDSRSSYFNFLRNLRVDIDSQHLSEEFLRFTGSYISYYAATKRPNFKKTLISTFEIIADLFSDYEVKQVLDIRNLSWVYRKQSDQYNRLADSLFQGSQVEKKVIDSIFHSKYNLPIVGDPITDFILTSEEGKQVKLSDQINGQYTILNFWAPWCKPCIRQFPFENSVYEKFKGEGLSIVNICFDTTEEEWRRLSKKHDLRMVNLFLDSEIGDLIAFKRRLGIDALPRSVLIDKDLIVVDNLFPTAEKIDRSALQKMLQK